MKDKSLVYKDWPFLVVGALIKKGNKFLLVKEGRVDKGLWNQPAGWLNKGEDIIEGVKREVKEETGLKVKIKGLLGIFSLLLRNKPKLKTDLHAIKIIFAAEAVGSKIKFDKNEIIDAQWFTPREIEKMKKNELRDMDIKIEVKKFVENKIYPTELIFHTETKY